MDFSFPTQNGLATLLGASLFAICSAQLGMYMILVQTELQSTLSFTSDCEEANEVQLNESISNEEDSSSSSSSTVTATAAVTAATATVADGHRSKLDTVQAQAGSPKASRNQGDTDPGDAIVSRRLYLPRLRRITLAVIVATITFMAYLFLARSNANIVLRWIGMGTVVGLLLRSTIIEELARNRYERLASLGSLLLVLAMALNLAVYASRQHAQGDIYKGKARIIGYDSSVYTQDDVQQNPVVRTDLQVAWGGPWGCPNRPNQYCQAHVAGALCETNNQIATSVVTREERNETGQVRSRELSPQQRVGRRQQQRHYVSMSFSHRRRRRRLREESEAVSEDDEQKKKNQELKDEHDKLEQENENLQEQNEELQDELLNYLGNQTSMDENASNDDGISISNYTFSDDMYDDEYWSNTAWEEVWGDYPCADLFDSELSGHSFDRDKPPGTDNDDWPFVNIYGNCNTCDAYVIDYLSSQHFQSILSHKIAALVYGLLAGIGLALTVGLILLREIYGPVGGGMPPEKEIELLPATISQGALA